MAQTDPASSAGEVPTSHPTGFWFFFWGELAERCCYYGMRTILPLFLSKELNFTEAQTSSVNYYFFALVYFMPLLGGYIADRYLGKYLTIVIFLGPLRPLAIPVMHDRPGLLIHLARGARGRFGGD